MIDAVTSIKGLLAEGAFRNEEHVRFSLVGRVLSELGWDTWNPNEVNTEFLPVPGEDQTRVDFALFVYSSEPSVLIEVKAVGRLENFLNDVERQLRDYNRNNTAPISIATDGNIWRFYFSQTGGEFSRKCFRILRFDSDDPEDISAALQILLSKESIRDGSAVQEAKKYLGLSKKQRLLEDSLGEAQRLVLSSPYPTLPKALMDLARDAGVEVSLDEVLVFIEERESALGGESGSKRESKEPQKQSLRTKTTRQSGPRSRELPPNGTECRFTYKGELFGGEVVHGQLVVRDLGSFSSFSAASRAATYTSRNGWLDWEIRIPGRAGWILAREWRESREKSST